MRSEPYRSGLRLLLYLATRTRPDIAIGVSVLAKPQEIPVVRQKSAIKDVVRFLNGTNDMGILPPHKGFGTWLEV